MTEKRYILYRHAVAWGFSSSKGSSNRMQILRCVVPSIVKKA